MGSTPAFRPQRPPLVAAGQIEHHVADLTVTVAADVTLSALQQALAEADQWLPIDGDPNLPVGILVESNSTGPLRLGFGAWRDLLLGMQFTVGVGRLITAGGRAMKNVAGYDLTKFMIGQFGMLGQVVTITTRTYKRPAAALLVEFDLSDKLIGELLPTSSRPQWGMLTEGFTWCGYLGDEKTIDFQESEMRARRPLELRRHLPQDDIGFRARRWLPPRPPVRYRASIPPARIVEFTQPLSIDDYAADAAFGIVVGSCPQDRKDAMISQARAVGGSIIFDDPQELASFFRAGGVERELLGRLQSAFDE